MNPLETTPDLTPAVVRQWHIPRPARHYARLGVFLALYAGSAWSVWQIVFQTGGNAWWWLAAVPLYVIAAASLHGISLFAHEAVHHTLARNRTWNAVLGSACAIPVLQNCSAYAVLHLRHHEHLGEHGDPDHYANYTRWTWMIFSMNWLRLMIGYPVYIIAIPILGFKHGTARQRWGIVLEIAVAVALMAGVLLSPLPRGLLLQE